MLTSTHFETPLGDMIAVSDAKALHLLSFMNYKNIDHQLALLHRHLHAPISVSARRQLTNLTIRVTICQLI